ncbi:hypothetical protein [Porphyromonas levii]|nr:hypothetical protein [Porphyromonas levii]
MKRKVLSENVARSAILADLLANRLRRCTVVKYKALRLRLTGAYSRT